MPEINKYICVITVDYPSNNRPVFTFLEQLVSEFSDLGIICSVIAPFSITKNLIRRIGSDPEYEEKRTISGNVIKIYRPRFISFSKFKLFDRLAGFLSKRAVNKVLMKMQRKPDVLYCHFWINAVRCYDYALKNNIPVFVATGESTIPDIKDGRKLNVSEFRNYVSGVICVSRKNKLESIAKGLTVEEKCVLLPNGVDLSKFQKRDKQKSCKNLRYSGTDFTVIFVGHFLERKGPLRVASAIKSLNDNTVKSIFIGSGPQVPDCEGILFRGSVSHDKVADYLNCADVFVLPTLNEGCCNAIIEAMACGLPIISSDLPFNTEILNDENSILVDPNDIKAIADAIRELRDDPQKRNRLSEGALETAKALSVKKRAEKIIEFIH